MVRAVEVGRRDVDFVESHQMELWQHQTGLSATLQFDLLPNDQVCTREFREEDREHDGVRCNSAAVAVECPQCGFWRRVDHDSQAKAGVASLWSEHLFSNDNWTTTQLDCIHSQAESYMFCTQAKRHTDLRNVTSAPLSGQLVLPCR